MEAEQAVDPEQVTTSHSGPHSRGGWSGRKGPGGSWGTEPGAKDATEIGAKLRTHLGTDVDRESRQEGGRRGAGGSRPHLSQ